MLKRRKVDCQCVHIRLLAPSPLANSLQVYDSEGAICSGKSLSLVVGLKPVKDVKRFRSDPTIRNSELLILFVSRNYQSWPSVYLFHALIVGRV